MARHKDAHERKMGSYFARNYRQGKPIRLPDEIVKDIDRDWGQWKNRRLRILGFYDEIDMRSLKFQVAHKAPPRIHLRGDAGAKERLIRETPDSWAEDEDSKYQVGHLEFKAWIQNKVENANSGQGSPRFLSEEDREFESDDALSKWEELAEEIYKLFCNRYFTIEKTENSRYRDSRQLLLLRKISARKRPDFESVTSEKWVFEDPKNPPPHFPGQHSPLVRIFRELIRILIGKSKTRDEYRGLKIPEKNVIPAAILIEELHKKIYNILQELENHTSEYSPDDRLVAFDGINFDEKETLDQIKIDGFGNSSGSGNTGTDHNSLKMAGDLIIMLKQQNILRGELMTLSEYLDHFHEGDDSDYSRPITWDFPHQLVFTKKFEAMIGGTDHPIFRWLRGERDRWMYCPPIAHSLHHKIKSGGFLSKENRRLIGGSHAVYEGFETDRCEPSESVVNALNTLQSTQWEINLDFLETLFDIQLNESGDQKCTECNSIKEERGDAYVHCADCGLSKRIIVDPQVYRERPPKALLPKGGWRSKKSRIIKIIPKRKFEEVFTPPDDKKSSGRTLVLEWTRRIIEHNANVFWHSWICDFRGRMSPRCPPLSPQGDDLDRALIRFKHWKPLGKEGIHWLRVHVHNMMEGIESELWEKKGHPSDCDCCVPAAKQHTFEQRSKWVIDNLDGLKKLATNPSTGTNRSDLGLDKYVTGKSEVFQRIAALVELDRVYREFRVVKNWDLVKSGQPIYLDASCNGYQHVSALLRDRELAEQVNIIGSKSPRDLYRKVAKNADKEPARDLISNVLNEFEGHEFEPADIEMAVDSVFDRSTAKMPTMTRVYGSKDIAKALQGKNGKGKPRWSEPASFELSEKDQEEFDSIPESATKAHKENRDDDGKLIWKEFNKHVPKYKKGKKKGKPNQEKAKYWDKLLNGQKVMALWNEGSGLHVALLRKKDEVSEAFGGDEIDSEDFPVIRQQSMLTEVTRKSFDTSIALTTGSAFDRLESPLKQISKSCNHLWKNCVRWKLPDGFVVRNYYIKGHGRDKTAIGQPIAPGSASSAMIPNWYKKDSKSIFNRVQELYSEDKRITGNKNLENALSANLDVHYLKREINRVDVKDILKIVDPKRKDDDANEIRDMLQYVHYSVNKYHEVEKERLDKRKPVRSLAPNFIHSLDALHMRSAINEISDSVNDLSFWAVHDAFGTHACDVEEMRKTVTSTFHDMHCGHDFWAWLEEMANFSGIDIEFQDPSEQDRSILDITEVKDAKYLIS